MPAMKVSVSLDSEVLANARQLAQVEGVSLSAWLNDAAQHKVKLEGLGRWLDEWEAEFGKITDEDLDAVEREVQEAKERTRRRRKRTA